MSYKDKNKIRGVSMTIDSDLGLNPDTLQRAIYLTGFLGVLIGVPLLYQKYQDWRHGSKTKKKELTESEREFLNGLDDNYGEVFLNNQLVSQFHYSPEQLKPFARDTEARFNRVMGGYHTLQMRQEEISEPVSREFDQFKSTYSEFASRVNQINS